MPIPTSEQVAALLLDAGISKVFSAATLEQQIEAAVATLDRETGYHTFVIGAPAALRFDPRDGGSSRGLGNGSARLRLPSGIVGEYAVEIDGVESLVSPGSMSYEAAPTWIRLGALPCRSVMVTGTFGYAGEIPGDVFDALMKWAAGGVLSLSREALLSDGLGSWEEAGVRESRDSAMVSACGQKWIDEAISVFRSYRRTDF